MNQQNLPFGNWKSTPSLYELEAANELSETQPALEQIQAYGLTRGESNTGLGELWRAFLRRFRKLEPVRTLVDRQPIWFPLIDLYVPRGGKAAMTYKREAELESGPELKILGSGFSGGLTTQFSDTSGFSAEGLGKSYQMKILVTAILYESEDGDQQVRLEPALAGEAPEYQVIDLPAPQPPACLESPDWSVIYKLKLSGASQGTYTWQREKVFGANWKVAAGIPIPESLGFTLNWSVKVSQSEAFEVKYEIPYGQNYIFYQPSRDVLLAPLSVCL